MSIGSYFVSDEASNTATNSLIEKFKSANEAKTVLENEMNSLSEKLNGLADVLKNPDAYRFLPSQSDLSVAPAREEYPSQRLVLRLQSKEFNFEHLVQMLTSYDKARSDKRDSVGRLRNMGLPIAD